MTQRWTPRPLDAARDLAAVAALWEAALGDHWPIDDWRIASAMPLGFGVERDGRLIGAIGCDPAGEITFVIVEPACRRTGVGRALHDAAVARISAGNERLRAGGARHIWRGIPGDLPEAAAFFRALGWTSRFTVVDMTLDLETFRADPAAVERATSAGVRFAWATAADRDDVVAYEEREHAAWVPDYRGRFPEEAGSVLVARDPAGAVVGALLIDRPPRHPARWRRMLGDYVVEIGCVGVAAARNGEGIGTALMTIATDEVKRGGARTAFLAWLVRIGFYERLGYRVWREYTRAELVSARGG
ncbi:MAG TPA: GNAT family N-acetyltransferase [Candidatus Limnocylindria bacterium]|nr:GNAT family N-acetyltransferase [Candidatus Limnocylindria bacterium]